jgi:hypothetical protein
MGFDDEGRIVADALAIERSWAVLLTVAFAVTALVAALALSSSRQTERVEAI